MTTAEIADKTGGAIAVDKPGAVVNYAYASDLLSDVMGHCGDESVLITIQNHLNTIAVCTLAGIEVIVICHGRPVPDDMAEAARREEVARCDGVGVDVVDLGEDVHGFLLAEPGVVVCQEV